MKIAEAFLSVVALIAVIYAYDTRNWWRTRLFNRGDIPAHEDTVLSLREHDQFDQITAALGRADRKD